MNAFALIGAAGYIAPRHMEAIKAVGGTLWVAYDPKDSVGIIDSYFPAADFFTEFERFDRHVDKLRRHGVPIECISICSPNYLHDAHCRMALRSDADAICEKPLVLNPWNIDGLADLERSSNHRIWTILQLRLHPAIVALRQKIAAERDKMHTVDLSYITARGHWYQVSWKGDEAKSGGVATNIGVHFFDMRARYCAFDVQEAVQIEQVIVEGTGLGGVFRLVTHRSMAPLHGSGISVRRSEYLQN